MRRAFLLASALPPTPWLKSKLKALKLVENDLRIGVDGGSLGWIKLGLAPEMVVGDGDSLGKRKIKPEPIGWIDLPEDKDRSDLYFAALAALEAGAEQIICLGVTGGRPDHQLAMLEDLGSLSDEGLVSAHGPEADYVFVGPKQPIELQAKKGQLVSVLPLSGEARGVTLEGFEYSLKNADLTPGSHGLSNVVKSSTVRVSLKQGQAVIIVPHAVPRADKRGKKA